MKCIGLTLSGGAIRGIVHLGVIKALEEIGIKPDIVAGTSMGSIIAGLYCIGLSYDDILKAVRAITPKIYDFDWKNIVNNIFHKSLPNGLIKGDKLEKLIDDISGGIYLSDIYPKKLGIVATNLNGGQNVVFTNGNINSNENIICVKNVKLSKAIRSSISLPFVFKPVVIEDMILVDGGIVDNCPINIAQELGADSILVSDIDYHGTKVGTTLNGMQILLSTLDVVIKEACEDNFKETTVPKLVINFGDIDNVNILNFTNDDINILFKIGYDRTITTLKNSDIFN